MNTLAKIKSVEDMIPKEAENQIFKTQPKI